MRSHKGILLSLPTCAPLYLELHSVTSVFDEKKPSFMIAQMFPMMSVHIMSYRHTRRYLNFLDHKWRHCWICSSYPPIAYSLVGNYEEIKQIWKVRLQYRRKYSVCHVLSILELSSSVWKPCLISWEMISSKHYFPSCVQLNIPLP